MNNLQIVWRNISKQLGSTLLSILLTAFGIAILCVIYRTSASFDKQLNNNSKHIDLVIGAKGSPLQLILSAVYHMDNPTGNIPLADAQQIINSPFVEQAVPISLGDNFKGHRIVGTNADFLALYETSVAQGRYFNADFEVVIGAEVAKKQGLKIGDQIHSSHGLSADGHVHDSHPFTVTGILKKNEDITDQLILCNLHSVWAVHGLHGPEEEHDHEHEHEHHTPGSAESKSLEQQDLEETVAAHQHHHGEQEEEYVKSIAEDMFGTSTVEITALLVKYKSPAAMSIIPKMVQMNTQMQAASPAIESARLFSLLGVGLDSLTILAYIIMGIAALSVFISLYNALKERKYDLAIMRSLGASQWKLFSLVILEGLLITIIGALIGLLLGHIGLYYLTQQTSASADFIDSLQIDFNEFILLVLAGIIGVISAVIPAAKAYQTTISSILSNK